MNIKRPIFHRAFFQQGIKMEYQKETESAVHCANRTYLASHSTSLYQAYVKAYNTAKNSSEQNDVVVRMKRVRELSIAWADKSSELSVSDFALFSDNVKEQIYSDFRDTQSESFTEDSQGQVFLVPYSCGNLDPKLIKIAFDKLGIMYSEKMYLGYLLYLDITINSVINITLIEALCVVFGFETDNLETENQDTDDTEMRLALYVNCFIDANEEQWTLACITTLENFILENEDLSDDEIQKLNDLKNTGDAIYINGYQTNRVKLIVL